MDFASLAERIRGGDRTADAEFVEYFDKRLKYLVLRQVRSDDYADIAHDALLIVLSHIREGVLRDPAAIPGYLRTVTRREIAYWIWKRVNRHDSENLEEESAKILDTRSTPEQQVLLDERRDVMRHAIAELKPRDQEILTRFYLDEQKQEQICAEMNLSPTQFRLVKSRAKNKFGEIGKRLIADKKQKLMYLSGKSDRDKKAA